MATYFKGVTDFVTGTACAFCARNNCDQFITNLWILRHSTIPLSFETQQQACSQWFVGVKQKSRSVGATELMSASG